MSRLDSSQKPQVHCSGVILRRYKLCCWIAWQHLIKIQWVHLCILTELKCRVPKFIPWSDDGSSGMPDTVTCKASKQFQATGAQNMIKTSLKNAEHILKERKMGEWKEHKVLRTSHKGNGRAMIKGGSEKISEDDMLTCSPERFHEWWQLDICQKEGVRRCRPILSLRGVLKKLSDSVKYFSKNLEREKAEYF